MQLRGNQLFLTLVASLVPLVLIVEATVRVTGSIGSQETESEIVQNTNDEPEVLSRIKRQAYHRNYNQRPYHSEYNNAHNPRPIHNSYNTGVVPDGHGGHRSESGYSGSSEFNTDHGNQYGGGGGSESGDQGGTSHNDAGGHDDEGGGGGHGHGGGDGYDHDHETYDHGGEDSGDGDYGDADTDGGGGSFE